jgi:DNA-binding transcriptional MerR regulator
MRIVEMAAAAGVSVRVLRHYEAQHRRTLVRERKANGREQYAVSHCGR